ncbi:hypothetical protein RN001_013343 [Aquatica leii]|uniref:Uncharacterized protein n=1 Tax=Aquatica leii TaxID=1421715 RepID=A0AAN7P2P7_9COLE|nr:hypothetical protein RN001_013343 [Aquatica leii]
MLDELFTSTRTKGHKNNQPKIVEFLHDDELNNKECQRVPVIPEGTKTELEEDLIRGPGRPKLLRTGSRGRPRKVFRSTRAAVQDDDAQIDDVHSKIEDDVFVSVAEVSVPDALKTDLANGGLASNTGVNNGECSAGTASAAEMADTVMRDGDTVIGPTVISAPQVVAQGDDLDAIAEEAKAGARLQADRATAGANIQRAARRMKAQYDKKRKRAKVGDLVLWRNAATAKANIGVSHKLSNKYDGPYRVTKVLAHDRKMPLYEEEQAKLLRLHKILEEIPSDPESEDDEEDAAATDDILGTYVLEVNNYLVPINSDENIVGLTIYDNLNLDQHIEFEDSMNIDEVDPPQDKSDSYDDTPIAVRLYRQCLNWHSQYPHISKRDKFDDFSGPNVVDVEDPLDIFLTLFPPDLIDKICF